MESYPSINGSNPQSYPSMWYAFDAGPARFYSLTAAWSDSNLGTGTVYENDRDAHWKPGAAEYEWLKADLAAHPNALKFAFWHYPLYADSSGQPSDTFLQGGAGTLQGLLDQNDVAIVFNGHAHGYERNRADAAGLLSYVVGNGGAALGQVSGCSAFDLYAIGASGTHCGSAAAGLSNDQVYGFVKVTVAGNRVTVTPTDELGQTHDVRTYTFASTADSTPPKAPTTVTATATTSSTVNVSWRGATDNVGVTGYHLFRNGTEISDQAGTSYVDTTVSPATHYVYTVVALDAAGNVSPMSAGAGVTTPGVADTIAPSRPGQLQANAASGSQVNLSWAASTDNIGVIGYRVYRNGTQLSTPTTPNPSPPTAFSDDTAQPATTYTYQVSALDAAGNESTKASVMVTTPGATCSANCTAAFDALLPARLMDTRVGPDFHTIDNQYQASGATPAGTITQLRVAGRGGVAADASAAVLNLTVTEPQGSGYLTVFPCGQPQPLASNLNYLANQTIANTVIATIGTNGNVCIFTSQTTHTIVDVDAAFA
jgi:chitodextrinase